ncbi:hypothetical protein RIF29_37471 [Crotalaria pallida]|uniref:Uncharacterized protein n=1 Tax=Crotalaria pallida TaxID=3830 RepID=A0AAN9EJ06_CROPI
MKMFSRFKSLSRAVHEEEEEEREHEEKMTRWCRRREGNNDTRSCSITSLTVWRKSLLMSCKGFTVIDSANGNLVYRVDNYIGAANHTHHITLMDASGNSVLTIRRRRKLGVVDSWFVYEGEAGNQRKRRKSNSCKSSSETNSPICFVKKHVNILPAGNANNVLAHVFRTDKRCVAFTIEGSYTHRTCKVLDECKRVLAEIKRKEADTKHVSFGMDIFQLVVQPGFDPAFAMALVLLLDQMFS